MANISSINGNPIVVGTSGVEDGAITLPKLNASVAAAVNEVSGLSDRAALASEMRGRIYGGTAELEIRWTEGGYINANDEIVQDANYKYSDYIDLTNVTRLYTDGGSVTRLHYYDDLKRSRATGAASSIDSTQPPLYRYARISAFKSSAVRLYAELTHGGVLAYSSDDGMVISGNRVSMSSFLELPMYKNNIVESGRFINNRYVAAPGVITSGTDSRYFCVAWIPVEGDTNYRANHGRNFAWLDSDGNQISFYGGTSIQNGVTSPENAAYLHITVNKSSDGISSKEQLYIAKEDEYEVIWTPEEILQTLWVRGKKINWIGDSIVAGADFDEVVTSAMGLVETDYGINGSTIALKEDGTDPRHAICLRYTEMADDADIIAVSAGTNDFQYSIPDMGTIQSTENTTFYGGLKTLCEGLINKYPQKVIFFTTPIKRAQPFDGSTELTTPFSQNAKGHTLKDYRDAIIEVCSYYSIPVLDLWGESLLNPHLDSQADMFDSVRTHPNATAMSIMARRVCGWLSQLGYNV